VELDLAVLGVIMRNEKPLPLRVMFQVTVSVPLDELTLDAL